MLFEMSKPYCYYFAEIAKIPHGSKDELALSDYLVSFAKQRNLRYKQDDMYNVIIYKDGSKGYEQEAPLILQAHMDMVCEKNKDVTHDFTKDSIQLVEKDGILRAKGTTLGADDGTGVAYMLAILGDDSLAHPPLECAFTVQEEIGLFGALHLQPEDFQARRMISLDGGGETSTLLSSAGGCRVTVHKALTFVANQAPAYTLAVRGLLGGHSGGEINKEKGNANKLLARVLMEAVLAGFDIRLCEISGGLKDNAIPREADALFAFSGDAKALQACFDDSAKDIADELEFSDAGFRIVMEAATASQTMSKECSDDVLKMLYLLPSGFKARSMAIDGLTLTSLNVGIVETQTDQLSVCISLRSAISSAISDLIRQIEVLTVMCHALTTTDARYPGWNYTKESKMREVMAGVVKQIYDVELELVAAHGGTECGVFAGMHEGMDIISIGAKAKAVHTPDEELDLASFDRAYKLLTSVIAACKE